MQSLSKKVGALVGLALDSLKHSSPPPSGDSEQPPPDRDEFRFRSFAAPSTGNVKWFVDGCSYFWAVSEALERELPLSLAPRPDSLMA